MIIFYAAFALFIISLFKYLLKCSTSFYYGLGAISDPLMTQLEQFRMVLICILACVAFLLFGQLVSGHFVINLNMLGVFNLLIITMYHIMKDPHSASV
jgi:hypothetical protein